MKTGIEENQNNSFYGERNRPRGVSGLLKFIHLVAKPTLVSKSPESKFKAFLLYPFKLLNRITLNQRSHIQKTTILYDSINVKFLEMAKL